jgi:signal transduction histidine kinase
MQLRIWHKIFIGVAIPSLIAITGSFITYGYITSTIERQGFVQIADDLKEDILEVRRNEKNFIHFKDEKQLQNVLDAISNLSKSLSTISDPSFDKTGKEYLSSLQVQLGEYSSVIHNLFNSYQSESRVVEKVRAEGRRLEKLISSGTHPEELSLNLILHLRLLEKNYMLFRDKKSLNKLEDGLSKLNNILPLCSECKPYIKSINSLMDTYRVSDSLADKLQMLGDNLEEISTQISNRERQMISNFLNKSRRLILMAVALLFILGPFFIYKTASYIVAPIKRLVEITTKISEGDTSLRAPLKEHDETYDLALSFNRMLDNLLSVRESLEKTVELLHEKQKEIEKRASLGFLVSGVTHELNNPLNNISLTAETIKEEIDELSREELSEFVQDILTQSERAKHIIDDLLDFAGTKKSQDMEKMDIVNAIEEAVNLTANELRINNITLEMDIPARACFVKGIKSKLEEVFVNIIVNAIHAINGKGKLTIRSWPDENNDNIYIQISDTGHGVSEENIKNIFEPFFTTKEVGEGTGLGLSVSQGIINDHNGDIHVESRIGKGTTFTIRLPLYNEAAKDLQ